jgi:hypothetical protein
MIAALEAAKAGLFRRDHWPRNIVAGVIVGVVALPLAMAFACEARPNVLAKLTRAGLLGEHAGKARYVQELSAAVRACTPDNQ